MFFFFSNINYYFSTILWGLSNLGRRQEWIYSIAAVDSVLHCGSFNVIGSHKLIRSYTIRGCGIVGVGIALLKEVCVCWGGL